jgi:hypothetical protein
MGSGSRDICAWETPTVNAETNIKVATIAVRAKFFIIDFLVSLSLAVSLRV